MMSDQHSHPPTATPLVKPIIGRHATSVQLEKIGFAPGEEIWIKINNNQPYRGIITSDWNIELTKAINPRDEKGKPITYRDGNKYWKLMGQTYADGIAYLQQQAEKGNDISLIPNRAVGGIRAVDIQECHCLFAEFDHLSLPKQWQRVQEFSAQTGIIPTLAVYSGGKSVHFYFRLSQAIAPERWQKLQRQIIILLRSDVNLQNYNREMRLAGMARGFRQVSIEQVTQHCYHPQELEQQLNSYFPQGLCQQRWLKARKLIENQASVSELQALLNLPEDQLLPSIPTQTHSNLTSGNHIVPLENCLTQDDKSLIEFGASEGQRDRSGYKLARNIIGTIHSLERLNIQGAGDGYSLFEQFASRCHPPLSAKDMHRIWNSAGKGNPTATLPDNLLLHQVFKTGKKPSSFKGHWFSQLLAQVQQTRQKLAWGFDKTQEQAASKPTPEPAPDSPIQTYPSGHRLDTWTHLDGKFIWDSSGTGTGKSYDTGQLYPTHLGCERLFYITADPRNPTTDTLAQWELLEGRHGGLTTDEHRKIRRVKGCQQSVGSRESGVGSRESGVGNRVEEITTPKRCRPHTPHPTPHTPHPTPYTPHPTPHTPHPTPHTPHPTPHTPHPTPHTPHPTPYSQPPNCFRTATISALREKGVSQADSSSLVCAPCPYYEKCVAGYQYGYLHARTHALKASRIRCHPATLPPADSPVYHNAVLIWEEWSQVLKNLWQISVTLEEVDQTIARLATQATEEFNQLKPLFSALRNLLSGTIKQPNRFGWSHHELIAQLPALPANLDLEKIEQAISPHLEFLDPTLEYGMSASELSSHFRKRFSASDETMAQQVKSNVVKQWLMPLLKILGQEPGYLSLCYGKLTLSRPNNRLAEIAHAAKGNIFLDATGDRLELAMLLGINPEQIICTAQEVTAGATIRRIQVATLGRLGQHRGAYQQRRVNAVIDAIANSHPDQHLSTIRFKRLAAAQDFRWFIESRGCNDLCDSDVLILDGIPCPNLEALAAEFTCLTGEVPQTGTISSKIPVQLTNPMPELIEPWFELTLSADPKFAAFVRRRILANIHQAEGRLRASRRPEQDLSVYILGDYPLDLPVELVKASEITLEAASKIERVEIAIRQAVEQLKATGERITQQAIANLTQYSRGHISRFGKLIQMLINNSTSKAIAQKVETQPVTGENVTQSLSPEELDWLSSEYLPLIASEPPDELWSLIKVLGKINFTQVWNQTTAVAQIEIWKRALLSLEVSSLSRLATAVGLNLYR